MLNAARKDLIRKELDDAARAAGGVLNKDEDLLETVTFLVENPHIITCEFNKDFLEIPDIVLITEMKEHQKYFAILSSQGKLINKFLVIANNPRSRTKFSKVHSIISAFLLLMPLSHNQRSKDEQLLWSTPIGLTEPATIKKRISFSIVELLHL